MLMMKLEIKSYTNVNCELHHYKSKILTFEKVQNIGKIMKQSAKQSKSFVILQLYSLLQSALLRDSFQILRPVSTKFQRIA